MVELNFDLNKIKIPKLNKSNKRNKRKSNIMSKKINKKKDNKIRDDIIEIKEIKKVKRKMEFDIKEYLFNFINKEIIEDIFSKINFNELVNNNHLKKVIQKLGYVKLTKIQEETFFKIKNKENLIIKSETGSGKTMAYSLPLVQQLIENDNKIKRDDGIFIIILSPTRELCLQIYKFLLNLCKGCINIVPGYLLGGEDIKKEKQRIRKGINILISTPGRLKYHLVNSKNLKLNNLKCIVFEECDRTLDFGFKNEIIEIINKIKETVDIGLLQIWLITATISKNIANLINNIVDINKIKMVGFKGIELNNFLNDDTKESNEIYYNIPSTLSQFYIVLNERNRFTLLLSILIILKDLKIIIFTSTADQANFLEKLLLNLEWNFKVKSNKNDKKITSSIFKLHGYTEQKERTKAYFDFNECKSGILISTDVGCRGLDFKNVKTILLFDIPSDTNDYINRVGRTARISETGISITFLLGNEEKFKHFLIKEYKAKELKSCFIYDYVFNLFDLEYEKEYQKCHIFFDNFISNYIKENDEIYYLSRRAFNSFCRAYGRIKDKENFSLKNLFLNSLCKAFGLKKIKSKNDETLDDRYIMRDKRFYNGKMRDMERNPYKVNPNQVIASEFL